MEQYIPKSVLVAEIEKRIQRLTQQCQESQQTEFFLLGKINGSENILQFLDTIEVKEVDIDEEFSHWWKSERSKDYNVDILYERYSNVSKKLARHFCELGLKAQKGGKL